jgi:hypothetical protein
LELMVTVCGDGSELFVSYWNDTWPEEGRNTGAADTFKITGTSRTGVDPPLEVIKTLPVYVPAAKPVVFTTAATVAGVVPLPTTNNQLPPNDVTALEVKETAVEPLLTTRACAAGGALFTWYE